MEGEIDWKWLRVDATMLHVQNDMRQRVGWEIDVDEGENEKLGVWACMRPTLRPHVDGIDVSWPGCMRMFLTSAMKKILISLEFDKSVPEGLTDGHTLS